MELRVILVDMDMAHTNQSIEQLKRGFTVR
jgi:hypothetical protein